MKCVRFRWFNGFPAVAWIDYEGTPYQKSSWRQGKESRVGAEPKGHVRRCYIDDDGRTLVLERGPLRADQDQSYRQAAPIDHMNALEIMTTDVVNSAEVELSPRERADYQRDNLLYAEHWLIRAHFANGSSRVIARSCAAREEVEQVNIDLRMAFIEQRPRDGWKRFELAAAERKEVWLGPFAELGAPLAIAAARPRVKVEKRAGLPVVWWIEERLDGPTLTYWENSISVGIRDGKARLDRTSWNIAISPVGLVGAGDDFEGVDRFSTDPSVLEKAASKFEGGKADSGRQVALLYKAGYARLVVDSTDPTLDVGALCVIRAKPATDSDAIRPPVPMEVGHLFRSNPATPSRWV
jgi:hypothetical protein